jgi:tryptophan synthase alpha chain
MSRIEDRFVTMRERRRKGLIPFVTAGDPNPQVTVPLMHALVSAGADILELGVPFSDPMADGPVIQRSSERALAQNTTLSTVLDLVREFRKDDSVTPVVLMGYVSPFETMGYDIFAKTAAEVGVDGVIAVDLPPEEAEEFRPLLRANEIDLIFLLAPTSDAGRIAQACSVASGFIYFVSLKGVTGASHLDVRPVAEKVAEIKNATELPVSVGFGIHDSEMAEKVAAISDAIVVGSALVHKMEQLADRPDEIPAAISSVIKSMRHAIDGDDRIIIGLMR